MTPTILTRLNLTPRHVAYLCVKFGCTRSVQDGVRQTRAEYKRRYRERQKAGRPPRVMKVSVRRDSYPDGTDGGRAYRRDYMAEYRRNYDART